MKFIKVYGLSTEIYVGDGISFLNLRFENDVELYGTQTEDTTETFVKAFENDVELYGTQTCAHNFTIADPFENDVELYGTQTAPISHIPSFSLRMM